MKRRLSGVAGRLYKRLLIFGTASVMAFSSLAVASPLFFTGIAHAATGNTLYVNSATGDDRRTCLDQTNPCRTVAKAIENSSDGDTIQVAAGTYSLASTLSIDKSVAIDGAGVGSTIINASGVASGYGVYTNVDNVTIENLSIAGPANSSGYGLKIEGSTTDVSASASNIALSNVSVSGSYRTGIDLNGINGATLTNVSSTGTIHGNGIALTDSRNVTIDGAATSGNAWGGIALYATGSYYTCGVDNVTLSGTNSLGDVAALYTGVDNPSNPACTITNLNLSSTDLPYKVSLTSDDPQYVYTTSLSNAGLVAAIYSPFSPVISESSDSASLWVAPGQTIQNVINASQAGDTINIPAGTYDGFSVNGKSNLTIAGAGVGSTAIAPTALVSSGIQHKYTSNMQVSVLVNNSTGITIEGMTINDNGSAPGLGGPDALVFWNASSGTIQDSNVTGTYTINGIQTGQGVAVDASGSQNTSLNLDNVNISGFQKNGIDAINGNGATSGATGTVNVNVDGGSITGAGSTSAIAQNGIVLWDRGGGTVTGSVSGATVSGFHYTPLDVSSGDNGTGILTYGTSASVSVTNSSLTDSDLDAANATASGTFNASSNYWGSGSPDFSTLVGQVADGYSPVSYIPYYTDAAMTTLSQSSTSSNNIGSLIGSGTNDVLQLSTDQKTITVQQDTTISIPSGTNQSSVILPTGTQITQTNGNAINSANITASTPSTGAFTSLGANKVVDGALQWGIPGIHLSFSQPITISIYVGTSLNGQTLNIVHSATGNSDWTSDGIVSPATCVVTAGYCTFQATEASYYAATETVTPVSTSSSSSSSSSSASRASTSAATSSNSNSSDSSDNSEVLGANSSGTPQILSNKTNKPSDHVPLAVVATSRAKIFGLVWYWWIPIIIAAVIALSIARGRFTTSGGKS